MLPDGRRLGAHLPLADGMVKAADRAHEIGATTIQVFADNPTAWRRRPGPPREVSAFRARLATLDIRPVAIHAPYLVNLAGADEVFHARSVAVLAHELMVAPAFGARFVNVHVGSHRGSGVVSGTARVADGLRRVFAELDASTDAGPDAGTDPPLVVLENSAGGGFGLGATVEELAAILEAADARGVDVGRIAFCLDTAHAWGAGYRISEPHGVDDLLALFDRLIGLDRLVMVHINDSKAALGSRADRHAHIGAGLIGPRGLACLLTHPRLARASYYLETPGMDEGFDELNMARAVALARGEEMPPLPPGARRTRGGRRRAAPPPESD